MTDSIEDVIRSILLPSEEVKVVLETVVAPTPGSSNDTTPVLIHERNKRILAVISRLHTWESNEQGCLFVFKHKSSKKNGIDDLVIDNVIPVVGDFSISMAQSRRNTIDLRNPTPALTLNQPRTEMMITINPGQMQSQDQNSSQIILLTNDLHRLRLVLAECRRLKGVADRIYINFLGAAGVQVFMDYSIYILRIVRIFIWHAYHGPLTVVLIDYFTVLTCNRTFSSAAIPSDLRLSRLPLHTRLSPASAGLPGDDLSDIQFVREQWVVDRARELCNKNKARLGLRIRIGSFNVNGQMPDQDLNAWVQGKQGGIQKKVISPLQKISPLSLGDVEQDENGAYFTHKSEKALKNSDGIDTAKPSSQPNEIGREHEDSSDPDILVLAFQELDLSTEALLYSTKTVREDAWTSAVFAGLGEKAEMYEKLASKQLVGMLLIMIVRKSLRDCFGDMKTCSAGAGIMGLMGNKGGTALRVTYSPPLSSKRPSVPTTLTFVNSHLAAFDEMVERRNADFHDLSRRLLFQHFVDSETEGRDGIAGPPVNISVFETDILFWLVDLNYRIDLPSEDVRQLLSWPGNQEKNLSELLKFDQLNNSARRGHAFESFVEHPISHLPTYRFSTGLATDHLGYDIKRKPAWTDRILYMTSGVAPVQQLTYRGHPEITLSDHRPVSAEFIVSLDAIELREYEITLKKLNRDVSDMDSQETVPNVKVDPQSIDFGLVRYRRTSSKSVVVRNCGKVPCAFRFVSPESKQTSHPGWLRVEPMTGLLLPDNTVTINLVVDIDNSAASALNIFHKHLEFTLILHTELGKDHFISISAEYEPTCFANSLSHLVRLPGPIRSVESEKQLLGQEDGISAPKEVMRLVNWMMTADVDAGALFTSPGDQALVDIIRECLDTGRDFLFPEYADSNQVALAFAETLLQLLDSLTEPLVPPSLHHSCAEVTSKDEAFELLDQFPPTHVNVWISVTAFLHFISQQGGDGTRAKELASVFGPVVLRGESISPLAKRQFLLFIIA